MPEQDMEEKRTGTSSVVVEPGHVEILVGLTVGFYRGCRVNRGLQNFVQCLPVALLLRNLNPFIDSLYMTILD